MSYTVTVKSNNSDYQETKVLDYAPFNIVYYVFKKRNQWVIRKSQINSFWFTNIFGYNFDNGWCVTEKEFNKLFKNKEDAISKCIELNKRDLVKIYNKDSWSFVD